MPLFMGVHEGFPGTATLIKYATWSTLSYGTCNKHGTGLGGYVRGTGVKWVLSKHKRWACRKYMCGVQIRRRYKIAMGVQRTE